MFKRVPIFLRKWSSHRPEACVGARYAISSRRMACFALRSKSRDIPSPPHPRTNIENVQNLARLRENFWIRQHWTPFLKAYNFPGCLSQTHVISRAFSCGTSPGTLNLYQRTKYYPEHQSCESLQDTVVLC